MKWLIKILLTVTILLGAYSLFHRHLSGGFNPVMNSSLPNPGDLVAKVSNWISVLSQQAGNAAGMEHSGKSRVYRWRDAEGVVHVSDQAPEGIEHETLWVDPNQSLLEP